MAFSVFCTETLCCCFLAATLMWSILAQFGEGLTTERTDCEYLNSDGTNLYLQSLKKCKNNCASRPWCKAVNYFRKEQKCVLLKSISGAGVATGGRSCVHVAREAMESANCKPKERCNQTSNQTEIIECQPYGRNLSNGEVLGNMYHVGSRLRVRCADKFVEVTGNDRTECLSTGLWSHHPRCIKINCDEPEIHNNATLSEEILLNGTTRTYTCNTGFGVNGSRSEFSYRITCVNESWEYGNTSCSAMHCDEPAIHNNATLSEGNILNGTTRMYTCNKGFGVNESRSETSYRITCINGSWKYGNSRCSARCPVSSSDFEQIGSQNLTICTNILKQHEAAQACSITGELVRIETAQQQENITSKLNNAENGYSGNDFWIQGMREEANKTWEFENGDPITQTFWDKPPGKNQPHRNCILLWSNSTYQWHNRKCSRIHGYICVVSFREKISNEKNITDTE